MKSLRKISAHRVYTGLGNYLKHGIVVLDHTNKIVDVIDRNGATDEIEGLEFYSGIIVPGFVNAHCHLELSHLRGVVPQGGGLPLFLRNVVKERSSWSANERKLEAKRALNSMYNTGIVAIGDVMNTADTLDIKRDSSILFHNFIEVFGTKSSEAQNYMNKATELYTTAIKSFNLPGSIVPHAPYSLSAELFELILEHNHQNNSIVTIHNQETKSENELYQSKSGDIFDQLVSMGMDFSTFNSTGKSSVKSIFDSVSKGTKTLLVHNIYTVEDEIRWIQQQNVETWFVLCACSNLYIEGKLPDIKMIKRETTNIALGTDSYSSNTSLSILNELRCIQDNIGLSFSEILPWATINGAKALSLDKVIGSLEIGKKPGVLLIEQFDYKADKLSLQSKVQRLV